MYQVKEMFYTLQGEGAHAGRPAVFCRFSGCNLWSGREQDRSTAVCQFCDTDFIGTDGQNGGKFQTAQDLAQAARNQWLGDADNLYIVITGGEPLLQLDSALIDALHTFGFEIAVETNGTLQAPDGIDWICVSPKAGAEFVQTSGHELKLVFPQPSLMPDALPETHFKHYYLQPMDGANTAHNTKLAIDYCKAHPKWRLSLQTHKILGID
jgi:7-carboxy-7-deazaguanine synthase (Cx14CxxC type)